MNMLISYYVNMFQQAAVGTVGYLRTQQAIKEAFKQNNGEAFGDFEGNRFEGSNINYYQYIVIGVFILIMLLLLYFTLKK